MRARMPWQVKEAMKPSPSLTPARSGLLQRKCACGGKSDSGGECEDCAKKRLGARPSPFETQTRLTITQSGDMFEQEADRAAETAVPGGPASRLASLGKLDATKVREGGSAPPIVRQVLQTSGQPLDASTRAFMEPRFGHDFSSVRVHAGARAAESADAVGALAYTVGRDVVFAKSQYAPRTRTGQRLLAHELTHVVQQSGSSRRVPQAATEHSDSGAAVVTLSINQVNSANTGFIQRQPTSEGPTFRDLPIFLEKLELDVGKNLQDYGHHLYQAAILHPDEPEVLENALTRYALGLNVLKTSYRFAGFKPDTADKLALGTGILFKSLTFVRKGEFVLDFQVDIGRGVKFETNLELGVNPENPSDVRKAGLKFGFVRRF